jgi:hypothetical protein
MTRSGRPRHSEATVDEYRPHGAGPAAAQAAHCGSYTPGTSRLTATRRLLSDRAPEGDPVKLAVVVHESDDAAPTLLPSLVYADPVAPPT